MATFSMGNSQYDDLFNEYILPTLHTMFVANTVLYDRFKTDTTLMRGEYGVLKLATAGSKSARPSSSSTFPTARQGSYAEFICYMKRGMYATLQFDNLALACGKDDGAFRDLLETEIEGQKIYISNKLNRQFWGDGSGRLAQLDAASSASTTVSINSPIYGLDSNEYTQAYNLLEVGQYVDIYDESGNLQAEEIQISAIASDSDGTATLTMESAVTASDDAWIFDHDTYAATEAAGTGVPMGLRGIVSTSNPYVGITATSAFQYVNRSSYTYAQAQAFTMGSSVTAVKDKKVMEMIQKCEKEGRTRVLITNGPIYRSWAQILKADLTLPNVKKQWGGTEGIVFYGGRTGEIPIIYDDDAPDQTIMALDDETIKVASPSNAGMEWVPGDTGILTRVQGKDEVAANLRWYYNMMVSRPRANGIMTNVKHLES